MYEQARRPDAEASQMHVDVSSALRDTVRSAESEQVALRMEGHLLWWDGGTLYKCIPDSEADRPEAEHLQAVIASSFIGQA